MAMGIDINIRILVTPETLISTADKFLDMGTEAIKRVNEMISRIDALEQKWKGEASQAYVKKFRNLQDDMQKMANMIGEHVSDLKTMAERYRTAEDESKALIEGLADDVIV